MIEVLIFKDNKDIVGSLVKYFGKAITLQKTPQGMPYIPEINQKISVTHKNQYLVVAISGKAIGVDLEQVCEKKSIYSIAKRYFAPNEIEYATESKHFFELWTRKEALGKLLGSGINSNILGINVARDSIAYEGKTLFVRSFFEVIENYCLSVVSEKKDIKFLYLY